MAAQFDDVLSRRGRAHLGYDFSAFGRVPLMNVAPRRNRTMQVQMHVDGPCLRGQPLHDGRGHWNGKVPVEQQVGRAHLGLEVPEMGQ